LFSCGVIIKGEITRFLTGNNNFEKNWFNLVLN